MSHNVDRRGSRQYEFPFNGEQRLRTVGLFAGIGGIELGLRDAGHPTLSLCEIDHGAQAVLEARFPNIPLHDDVTTLEALPDGTDLVVGGFPCQDLSQAGQTRGIEGAKSGLVGHVFRLVQQQRVPWLLLENVPFMLQLSKGRALDVIVTALEELGYRWAYRVVDALAFGRPQRRKRVYIVAALDHDPRGILFADEHGEPDKPQRTGTEACGFYWTEGIRGLGWAVDAVPTLKGGSSVGVPSPPAMWMPDGMIAKPAIQDAERLQGFRGGWTKPAESVVRQGMRWRLIGNAVNVPVARWLGRCLAKPRAFETPGARPVVSGKSWPTNAWNVGDGRFTCDLSTWPISEPRKPLMEFLSKPPVPLSERATAGFLGRTQRAKLRFPEGFIDAVRDHLDNVRAASVS